MHMHAMPPSGSWGLAVFSCDLPLIALACRSADEGMNDKVSIKANISNVKPKHRPCLQECGRGHERQGFN